MSNFIYNDNFNQDQNGDGKEPIIFNFGPSKAATGISKLTLSIVCVFCILISATLGLFGGILVTKNTVKEELPNTVYTNTVLQSSETSSPASKLTAQGGELTRADVIESIKDTVVEITTQYAVTKYQFVESGAGSGVIIGKYAGGLAKSSETEQGYYIITNAHVIESAVNNSNSVITVTLTNGKKYDATVVGSDSTSDIAILKIAEENELKCAVFANDDFKLRVGDEVIAIGNPLGQLGGTVTNGYISALDREITIDGNKMNLLQTDAPINPGNSGGGLFNLRGELVGIVNAKSTGTDIEGLGFAIPSKDALAVFEDFINLGYVKGRPTIYAEYDMTYSYNSYSGIYVTRILERSTGDNSDKLQEHDEIIGAVIDGKQVAVSSASQLNSIINSSEIGSELTLIVRRGYQTGTVTVTIFEFYK